ncbi:MAG: hypothetical protein LBU70_03045 [Chitinispirillales bacterium]|nr:hypothetical protein [Chitinispirillales bacterium]
MAELRDIVAQIGISIAESRKESEELQKKWDHERGELQKKWDREREERQKKWDSEREERRKETERELAETRRKADLAKEEADLAGKELKKSLDALSKTVDRVTKNVDRVTKNVGGLNNSIGEIVEMIIIPGVKEKMNELGHNFNIASPRRKYSNPDNSTLAEVDLLLENCTDVMVVEVKTQTSLKWVERHLKRLELLRKKQNITGMTGKTMYAAIAGVNFDNDARELAVANGMYLIEIEEESERINIVRPEKAGTW